jgi:hypothetical protein
MKTAWQNEIDKLSEMEFNNLDTIINLKKEQLAAYDRFLKRAINIATAVVTLGVGLLIFL